MHYVQNEKGKQIPLTHALLDEAGGTGSVYTEEYSGKGVAALRRDYLGLEARHNQLRFLFNDEVLGDVPAYTIKGNDLSSAGPTKNLTASETVTMLTDQVAAWPIDEVQTSLITGVSGGITLKPGSFVTGSRFDPTYGTLLIEPPSTASQDAKLYVYNSGNRNQSIILDGASGTSPSIIMRSNSTDRAGIRWNNSVLGLGITNNYGSIDLTPGSGGSLSGGMKITPTGAGVGNTSPRVLLDVGTSSDAPAESSGLVGFFSTGGTARVSVRNSTNNIESTLVSGSSQGGIGTVTNHPFSLLQNNAVAATVGTNGYLGVNQPNPLHVLHVGPGGDSSPLGSSQVGMFSNNGSTGISVRNSSGDVESFLYASSIGLTGTVTSHEFRIRTGNTDAISIDTSQNVIVGATSAIGAKLEVVQTSNGAPALLTRQTNSTTSDAMQAYHDGNLAFAVQTRSNLRRLIFNGWDNGSGTATNVHLNRNNNASTPSAGYIVMVDRGGSSYRVWPDDAGLLRIWNGGDPTSANDTSGTVVGSQTSHISKKIILGDSVSPGEALSNIMEASLMVKRFYYRDGAFGHETFEGIVLSGPVKHRYGKDADRFHPAGKSLNEITLHGDEILAITELGNRTSRHEQYLQQIAQYLGISLN